MTKVYCVRSRSVCTLFVFETAEPLCSFSEMQISGVRIPGKKCTYSGHEYSNLKVAISVFAPIITGQTAHVRKSAATLSPRDNPVIGLKEIASRSRYRNPGEK